MQKQTVKGPVNFTAPNPVTMKIFGTTCKSVTPSSFDPSTKHYFKTISRWNEYFSIRRQKVLPNILINSGYDFAFSELEDVLENIF